MMKTTNGNFIQQGLMVEQHQHKVRETLKQLIVDLKEKYGATIEPMFVYDEMILEFPEGTSPEKQEEAREFVINALRDIQ